MAIRTRLPKTLVPPTLRRSIKNPSDSPRADLDEGNDDAVYGTMVRFNVIYVLESLGPGELKTGSDLFDSVIYPATLRLPGMHAEYSRVENENALMMKLTHIAHAASVGNHLPIVHVEAHGGLDGIELADGHAVPWRRLIPALVEINKACRNNLIVVAISCRGWNLTASLMPSDRAPVFMLVGPPGNMTAGDLLRATRSFYQSLVEELDLNRALEAMNARLPYAKWHLKPATAEILFCRVFRSYVGEESSAEALRERENRLVAGITSARDLTALDVTALRLQIRADLADHRAAYDRIRETFLMLDLFPEDRPRFGLTYDRCFPAQG